MLHQMNLSDIYRIFYSKQKIDILLEHTWNILQDRSYFRPQISLNKFKNIGIILRIFSNHNDMKPEINYKNKNGKFTSM